MQARLQRLGYGQEDLPEGLNAVANPPQAALEQPQLTGGVPFVRRPLPGEAPAVAQAKQAQAGQAQAVNANTVGYEEPPGAAAPREPAPPPEPKLIGMTKAGYVPHSQTTTVEKGVDYSPETKAAEATAMHAGVEANKLTEEAVTREREEARIAAHREAAQLEADRNEYAVRKDQQNNARQEHWAKLQESESELSHAQAQGIDPNRYMNSMSTGGKVATLISLMAGGFAAGVRGGPNEAMAQLNATIDRDIMAQREALSGKEKSVAAGQSLYGILRQKGMDDDAAADGAKILAHQLLQKQLEAELTNAKDAQARLIIQQSIEKNSAFLSELGAKFDTGAANKVQTTTSQAYQQAHGIYSGVDHSKEILRRTQDIRDKSGGAISIDDARSQATAEIMGSRGVSGGYQKPGKDSAIGAPISLESPQSTAFEPLRMFGATSAGAHVHEQEAFNSQIFNQIPGRVEQKKLIGAPYIINPGDSESVVKRKVDAAVAAGLASRDKDSKGKETGKIVFTPPKTRAPDTGGESEP